jgi:hypothetical protein
MAAGNTMKRSKAGRPTKASQRRSDTITFRVRAALGDQLRKTSAESNRSLSDEIEFRLERSFAWDAAEGDINKMREEAKTALSTARIRAIREAGFQLLRQAGGNVTINISPELLLAEAEGILRSGFVAEENIDKSPIEIAAEKAAEAVVERFEKVLADAGLLHRKKGAA